LSRLTIAWLAFAGLAAGAAVWAVAGGPAPLVAMAVEGVERFARADGRAAAEAGEPERLAPRAPKVVAKGEEEPYSLETDDILAADVSYETLSQPEPEDDVVITIDGVPARAMGAIAASVAPLAPAKAEPIAAIDKALLAASQYGQLPKISADGRKPSKAYAQPWRSSGKSEVAIIVGGLGLNRALTERAIDELPGHVGLAFAPYAKDLPFWTERARRNGHEVFIEIPMEHRSGDSALLGAAGLTTARTEQENAQRLEWILSRFQGYVGATNYLGSKFSADAALGGVLDRLGDAGLLYVDDTGAVGRGARGATSVTRMVDPGYAGAVAETTRDLEALEKSATDQGAALGKTYVSASSLTSLVAWASGLEARGVALAPPSAVIARRSDI
jgi:polysaccharide deacetylase 2 family uncharacterized protein YibQ